MEKRIKIKHCLAGGDHTRVFELLMVSKLGFLDSIRNVIPRLTHLRRCWQSNFWLSPVYPTVLSLLARTDRKALLVSYVVIISIVLKEEDLKDVPLANVAVITILFTLVQCATTLQASVIVAFFTPEVRNAMNVMLITSVMPRADPVADVIVICADAKAATRLVVIADAR